MKKVLFQAISLSFLWIVFMTFAALAEVQNNIEVGQMKNYRLNLWSKGIIYLVEMRQVGIPGIGIFSVRLKSGKKTLNWYEIPGEEAQERRLFRAFLEKETTRWLSAKLRDPVAFLTTSF